MKNFIKLSLFISLIFSSGALSAKDQFKSGSCYAYKDAKDYIAALKYEIKSTKYNVYLKSGVSLESVMKSGTLTGTKISAYIEIFYDFVNKSRFESKVKSAIETKGWSRERALKTVIDARSLVILEGKQNGVFFDKLAIVRNPEDGTIYTMKSDFINENDEITQYCVTKVENM